MHKGLITIKTVNVITWIMVLMRFMIIIRSLGSLSWTPF